MKEKLKQFKKIQSEFTQELKAYCKDKSIPIDERWEVFTESGMVDLLPRLKPWDSNAYCTAGASI